MSKTKPKFNPMYTPKPKAVATQGPEQHILSFKADDAKKKKISDALSTEGVNHTTYPDRGLHHVSFNKEHLAKAASALAKAGLNPTTHAGEASDKVRTSDFDSMAVGASMVKKAQQIKDTAAAKEKRTRKTESIELDEASKTKTFENGIRKAVVYPKDQYGEHVVKFHIDGKHQKNADYHSDDTEDAHGTAQHFVNNVRESEELDELKKSTLVSYVGKASHDLYNKGVDRSRDRWTGNLSPENDVKGFKKIANRMGKISTAARKLSEGEIGMNESNNQTISLIDAISQGDTIGSAQLFGDALLSKVSDLIDSRRQEVAQNMFESKGPNDSYAKILKSHSFQKKGLIKGKPVFQHPLYGSVLVNKFGEWEHTPHGVSNTEGGFGGTTEHSLHNHLTRLKANESVEVKQNMFNESDTYRVKPTFHNGEKTKMYTVHSINGKATPDTFYHIDNLKSLQSKGHIIQGLSENVELDEAKELTLHKKIQSAVENGSVSADDISKDKEGNTILRRGFYYRHGNTSHGHAEKMSKELHDANIDHEVVDHGEVDKPFKGGASIKNSSHFWVKVKPKESIKDKQ